MDKQQHGRQTKQWKDMSAGERTKGIITLVVILFIAIFVVKLVSGGGGDSTTQTTDTSSAQSSQPSVAQQVSAWYSKYGYIVHTFGDDASKTSTDAQSGDVAQVGADCGQLQTDIKTAQSFPAIPDPQTASDFSSALSYYSDGVQDCIDGATNYDASLMNKSAQEISQGNTQLGVAANDINNLASN